MSGEVPVVSIRPSIGAAEYPVLVAIWRGAVDATHDFEVVGRGETDEAGRPYPLLHLRLGTPS